MTANGPNRPGSDNSDLPGTDRSTDTESEPDLDEGRKHVESLLKEHGGALWRWQLEQLVPWSEAYVAWISDELDGQNHILLYGIAHEQRLYLPEYIPPALAQILPPRRLDALGIEAPNEIDGIERDYKGEHL